MNASLNLTTLRGALGGLFTVRARVYWTDFLASLAIGYGAFFASLAYAPGTAAFWILLTVAGLGLYRAVSFIHEISHFRGQLKSFTIGWNALCGVPLAMPSFLYYQSHFAHHRAQTYGTAQDGEYIAFANRPRWELFKYMVYSFVASYLLLARFMIFTPISYCVPSVRRWLIAHGSSLVIESTFVGAEPSERDKKDWRWQEPATMVFWWGVALATIVGWIPLPALITLFGLMSGVHVLNGLRTLAAHRFANDDGALTMEQQYLDSVNLTGDGWRAVGNTLAAPVGLRYHALHHLFPGIPYHGLGEAHRRLSVALPKESVYFHAHEPTMGSALWILWKRAGARTQSVGERGPSEALIGS